MEPSKSNKSILFLTTLGVLTALLLLGGATTGYAQEGVFINKRPFKDLGTSVQEKIESKAVDLDAPFLVELTGNLNKSGKIDGATAKYVKSEGAKEVVDLAKEAIEAVNDSGYLGYLRQLDRDADGKITIRTEQGESGFSAIVSFEALNESRAKTLVSGLSMMISLVKQRLEAQGSADKDELLLISSLATTTEGKSIIVKSNIPKSSFREMIERTLAKAKKTPQS